MPVNKMIDTVCLTASNGCSVYVIAEREVVVVGGSTVYPETNITTYVRLPAATSFWQRLRNFLWYVFWPDRYYGDWMEIELDALHASALLSLYGDGIDGTTIESTAEEGD